MSPEMTPPTDDAEALALLFDDPGAAAAERLREVLDATAKRLVKGLQTGLPFGDEGFRGDRTPGGPGFRDPWPSSRNQVGHFLTAVGLAFHPEKVAEPILGIRLRDWLGAPSGLADASVGKRLTVGHEFAADPGVALGAIAGGLVGAALLGRRHAIAGLIGAGLGGFAGALAEQFVGFRRQYHRATEADEAAFDAALAALGAGPSLDVDAAEVALAPLFAKIDVRDQGNSVQDLRLSLLGWWLGEAIGRGDFATGADVADWVRVHLRG